MSARVRRSGEEQARRRPPTVGTISPGIKILTAKAAAIPGLKKVYDEGAAVGASYEEIEKSLKQVKDCPPYPLRPSNAPYFRVEQGQFTVPGAADLIMKNYATTRPGDTEPHLYSFPIVFRQTNIDDVFRERFEAWQSSGILRWSEEQSDGTSACMKKEELGADKNRRRRWGGREDIVDRVCDPNDCDFFQAEQQQCFHSASLFFIIPALPGVGLIELSFKSIYGSGSIMDVLMDAQDGLRGLGLDINSLYKGQPIFSLSKRREEVAVMDWKTGKPSRRVQDIIHLDAVGINLMDVMRESQGLEALTAPVAALPGPSVEIPTDDSSGVEMTQTGTIDVKTGEITEEPKPTPAKMTPEVRSLRAQLQALTKRLEWTPDEIKEWIAANYADVKDPSRDEASLIKMCTELACLIDPPVVSNDGEELI